MRTRYPYELQKYEANGHMHNLESSFVFHILQEVGVDVERKLSI